MRNTSGRATSALVSLCLVQGCERFAFFAMLPLFILYLHHRHSYGEPLALLVLGAFNGLSYVCGLPGGMLADRRLGPIGGLAVGAAFLTAGYGSLALDHARLLWPAFGLLVLGQGLFRPSMATLLGGLFPPGDARREGGFLWQYFVVNLACVLGPLSVGSIGVEQRWRSLFVVAAVAMVCGMVLVLAAWSLRSSLGQPAARRMPSGTSTDDKARWRAVWLLAALAVVFWVTAIQAGGSLALFAEEYTVRSIVVLGRSFALGPTQFSSLHGLLVLVLLPPFIAGLNAARRRQVEPSSPAKMVWGYLATAGAFALVAAASLRGGDTSRVSAAWLIGCYLLLSVAELLLNPLAMSLVTQIAPASRTGQASGLWFAAAAVGNAAAGGLGLLWGRWPNHRYFVLLALVSLAAAVVLFAQLRRLESVLRRH